MRCTKHAASPIPSPSSSSRECCPSSLFSLLCYCCCPCDFSSHMCVCVLLLLCNRPLILLLALVVLLYAVSSCGAEFFVAHTFTCSRSSESFSHSLSLFSRLSLAADPFPAAHTHTAYVFETHTQHSSSFTVCLLQKFSTGNRVKDQDRKLATVTTAATTTTTTTTTETAATFVCTT